MSAVGMVCPPLSHPTKRAGASDERVPAHGAAAGRLPTTRSRRLHTLWRAAAVVAAGLPQLVPAQRGGVPLHADADVLAGGRAADAGLQLVGRRARRGGRPALHVLRARAPRAQAAAAAAAARRLPA